MRLAEAPIKEIRTKIIKGGVATVSYSLLRHEAAKLFKQYSSVKLINEKGGCWHRQDFIGKELKK